jgi:hypothetical protein
MRIIAFTLAFLFSLLLVNKEAMSKSKCKPGPNPAISNTAKLVSLQPGIVDFRESNSLKPYDGFFIKI